MKNSNPDEPCDPSFTNLPVGAFELEKITTQLALSGIFERSEYVNPYKLFVARFGIIPNHIKVQHIDCGKAHTWFAANRVDDIKDTYYKEVEWTEGKSTLNYIYFFLYEDLVVGFDAEGQTVNFLFSETEKSKVEELIKAIHKFKIRKQKQKPEISLLVHNRADIETKSLQIARPRLSIEDNYNEDFKEVHRTILKRLSRKNDKGLVLLHGKPGTGKTSYIRYLICSLKKNVIFLPPNMASAITDPNLVSVLIENPNSIFVIENAENIIVAREHYNSSPVSALLNISDGLLADCLNVQIICSFNTDISKIDSALMRKGRLIAHYEFKELTTEKAQRLSDKLGFSTTISQPLTLATIYNQDEKEFEQTTGTAPIGFKALN